MSKRTRIARKEIKKMEAELHSDYAQFMQQMKDYLRFADVGADQKTLIYHDIVNMLLEGQARGQSVQEVIGDDYRVFCDEVIAAAPRLSTVLKWMVSWRFGLFRICSPIWPHGRIFHSQLEEFGFILVSLSWLGIFRGTTHSMHSVTCRVE